MRGREATRISRRFSSMLARRSELLPPGSEAAHVPCLSGVSNRVHLDRGGAATERLGTKGLEHVQVRACEATHGVGRRQEGPMKVARGLFETGSGVHHVAVKDDVALRVADFAADDWPCVEGCP